MNIRHIFLCKKHNKPAVLYCRSVIAGTDIVPQEGLTVKERRKNKRYPVTIHLCISSLYHGEPDTPRIEGLDSPVDAVDISLDGIAFVSECVLPLGYYFDADFVFRGTDRHCMSVVRIVRNEILDHDRYLYGCQFSDCPAQLKDLIRQLIAEDTNN